MVLSLIKWSLLPFLHLLHDKFVMVKKEIDPNFGSFFLQILHVPSSILGNFDLI